MKCEKCKTIGRTLTTFNYKKVCASCKARIILKNAERDFKMMDDLLELAKLQPQQARNRQEYNDAHHHLKLMKYDFEIAKKRYDYAWKVVNQRLLHKVA